jgi:uncharacterized protein YqgV (UPF0045/DUF77 family)
LEIGGLDVAQHGDTVVVGVVVVPLVARRVDEEHYIGEVFVIVNDVSARKVKYYVSKLDTQITKA